MFRGGVWDGGQGQRKMEESIVKIQNFSFIMNKITLLSWQQPEPKQQTQEKIQIRISPEFNL